MKIALASDHGGFELKGEIIKHLQTKGYDIMDYGTDTEVSCDYPDYAEKAAAGVTSGECDLGILICGTGQGIMMAANKVKGIRCAVLSDVFSAEMTRLHNDANMIALGGRVVGAGLALKIVDAYLEAEFEGGRHQRRVDKINAIEAK